PAANAHIDIMNACRFQPTRAADVVMIIRISAVDDNVARLKKRRQGGKHGIDCCGWHHQPHGARLCEVLYKCRQVGRAFRSPFDQVLDRLRVAVIDDTFMAPLHEADRHIGTHSTKTDYAKLHLTSPTSETDRSPSAILRPRYAWRFWLLL